jgi:hypothetical protein
MTNLTVHCPMDVSHKNAFTLPLVPGNVMTGTGNCNFDMNMFLRNVENSVSKILTEKEMVYHQRVEEMENRLRGFMAGIGPCSFLRAATTVSNLATSDSSSFASDHFLSVRSRMSVASYQTEAEMMSSEVESVEASVGEPDGLFKELGAIEASKTSGSGFEHIKAYVGNEYAAE